MATNVVMPQLGESVVEGTIGKWFKQVGDKIEQYEPIMEVVTDKVTTEIPSPAAGTLLQILVPEGTTVKAGTVLAMIGAAGEKANAAPTAPVGHGATAPTPTPAPPPSTTGEGNAPHNGHGSKRLTPVVARMIGEYNISDAELAKIKGSGEGGRVTKKDVESYVARRNEQPTSPPRTGEVETPPWEQPGTGELFRPTEEIFGKPASLPTPHPPPPSPGAVRQERGEGGAGGGG